MKDNEEYLWYNYFFNNGCRGQSWDINLIDKGYIHINTE